MERKSILFLISIFFCILSFSMEATRAESDTIASAPLPAPGPSPHLFVQMESLQSWQLHARRLLLSSPNRLVS
ncbi:hypothetical protein MANES_01G228750v8 [Manihot esculenta]|uniref:Uncharacterized protein n=1 Tax=Manihot esculenta TaxID=3983 RepID=A0ACB7IH59_MANES|nr:hypothetical protein MANES_01G228750v8 [Manihot esculenta]